MTTTHFTCQQEQVIQTQLQNCDDALLQLQTIVYKKRWQQLGGSVQHYQNAIDDLRNHMQQVQTLPSSMLQHFQHLSIQQRRIMRCIHQQMQQTEDDITSINKGVSKLNFIAQSQA